MNNTCISLKNGLTLPTLFLLLLHNSATPSPTSNPPSSTFNPPTPIQALSSDSLRLSVLQSHRRSVASPVVSGASTGSGQYFVHLRLGSPPQPLLLVADTGSDLVWLRCSACKSCSRRLPGSAFLARHSSTFSPFRVLPPPLPKVRWFMLTTLVVGFFLAEVGDGFVEVGRGVWKRMRLGLGVEGGQRGGGSRKRGLGWGLGRVECGGGAVGGRAGSCRVVKKKKKGSWESETIFE
ncbi:PREDICTED: uncharacterized protein LOC101292685 [Fragaria vesca subsp. vesca]|uniref:uncharacterized protein LOC101292685 n=1 Tax=Fragaria vesca subsp. vesca TaxID=101020 RepID=UPI0002C30900|nr:PREDICTED: uncharacterized protein LOC101292685 [Fragaria vesca subsp. vesca]